jgi:hypothetical protein
MKRSLKFCSLLLALLSNSVLGGSGGSGYSLYGLGDLRFFAGGRSAGMGGTGIGLLSAYSLNRLNPAGQTRLSRTYFTGTFSYEGFQTSDGRQTAYLGTGSFGGAFLALPLAPESGLVFSAGFNPYSTVNYKIGDDQTFGSTNYSLLYFGEGGLSTAGVAVSVIPAESLHVGFRLNYLFGQIRSGSQVTFTAADFSSVEYRREMNASGFSATVGSIFTGLGRITGVRAFDGLSLGAVFSTASNLSATQDNINRGSAGVDTLTRKEGTIRIPTSFGVGAAWLLGEKHLLAADFLHQRWSDYVSFDVHPAQIKNSTRVSVGWEIQPSRESGAGYWRRVAYRLGASHLSTYYQLGSQSINETAFSAGLGLPVGIDASLDLALEVGRRGTTDQQLLKDNIFRFSLTLNFGERWFIRAEEE